MKTYKFTYELNHKRIFKEFVTEAKNEKDAKFLFAEQLELHHGARFSVSELYQFVNKKKDNAFMQYYSIFYDFKDNYNFVSYELNVI